MRALIKEHLGEEQAKKYDKIIDACKLGNALKDERVWAPLCPSYPNLKGVTCEEVDEFIEDRLPDFFFTDSYEDYISDMITYDITYPEERPTVTKEELLSFIKQNIDEKEFDKLCKNTFDMNRDRIMFHIEGLKKRGVLEEPISPKQFTKDYLHHVRVYDRDEAYQAFKKIGKQIAEEYPDKYPNILNKKSTIFVTTPRGGHEMLSIFAYANNIDKAQIPSDITWQLNIKPDAQAEYGRSAITEDWIREKEVSFEMIDMGDADMFGRDWMDNRSDEVKTIFIVDDIIASGEQVNHTAGALSNMFPYAEINSITLCKHHGDEYTFEPITKNYYTDTETIGIDKFKELQEENKLVDNEYITCLFPHACPDGRSDQLIVELMGGSRCPPEKRIARRDL